MNATGRMLCPAAKASVTASTKPFLLATTACAAALALLCGCQSAADPNASEQLYASRNVVAAAQLMPGTTEYAAAELARAQQSLAAAERAFAPPADGAKTVQLATQARQQAVVAMNVAAQQRNQAAAQVPTSAGALPPALPPTGAGPSLADATPLERDLSQLAVRQRGTVVAQQDSLFKPDSAALKPDAQPAIGQLAAVLAQQPQQPVLIDGYAESSADAQDVALARKRADALRAALVSAGAPAAQIEVRQYGIEENHAAAPAAPVTTPRVEVLLSDDSGVVSLTQ